MDPEPYNLNSIINHNSISLSTMSSRNTHLACIFSLFKELILQEKTAFDEKYFLLKNSNLIKKVDDIVQKTKQNQWSLKFSLKNPLKIIRYFQLKLGMNESRYLIENKSTKAVPGSLLVGYKFWKENSQNNTMDMDIELFSKSIFHLSIEESSNKQDFYSCCYFACLVYQWFKNPIETATVENIRHFMQEVSYLFSMCIYSIVETNHKLTGIKGNSLNSQYGLLDLRVPHIIENIDLLLNNPKYKQNKAQTDIFEVSENLSKCETILELYLIEFIKKFTIN